MPVPAATEFRLPLLPEVLNVYTAPRPSGRSSPGTALAPTVVAAA